MSWAEPGAGERYLIHGRLVCEACAEKAKRRMPWELGALAGWAGLLSGLAAANIILGNVTGIALVIAGSASVVLVGTVQLMKLANRRAQRRIAAGEFPDYTALGGATTDSAATPPT